MIPRVLLSVCLCGVASGCARAVFVPPAGPGVPAPDAAGAWAEATAGCRSARSFAAALRVSGRVGSERIWPVAIEAAVTADQSIYLSATASGNSVFVLAGTANQATLWLRRDGRRVTAAPSAIMEAIVGVPLAPDQLLAVLTGCVTRSLEITQAERRGRLLAVGTADASVYLAQSDGRWRTAAAETGRFTVEFSTYKAERPDEMWIWSIPDRGPAASLHLRVSDGEVNGPIPATFFQIPAGAQSATPITIEELRAAGPWKARAPQPDPGESQWPAN